MAMRAWDVGVLYAPCWDNDHDYGMDMLGQDANTGCIIFLRFIMAMICSKIVNEDWLYMWWAASNVCEQWAASNEYIMDSYSAILSWDAKAEF